MGFLVFEEIAFCKHCLQIKFKHVYMCIFILTWFCAFFIWVIFEIIFQHLLEVFYSEKSFCLVLSYGSLSSPEFQVDIQYNRQIGLDLAISCFSKERQ
mgnify:FL=1